MLPDVLEAIMLAPIVRMPKTKKQYTASVQVKRLSAEELLAASIMIVVLTRR